MLEKVKIFNINNNEEQISAPKTIDRLEEISQYRNNQRKLESDDDDDDNQPQPRLQIFDQSISLNETDINEFDGPDLNLIPDLLLDDIEILV